MTNTVATLLTHLGGWLPLHFVETFIQRVLADVGNAIVLAWPDAS